MKSYKITWYIFCLKDSTVMYSVISLEQPALEQQPHMNVNHTVGKIILLLKRAVQERLHCNRDVFRIK